MAEKGLGPEDMGIYFALWNDPQTSLAGIVLNAELVRVKLGVAPKRWKRVLNRLAKTGFIIPSRNIKGLFLIPDLSGACMRTQGQFQRALEGMAGIPEDIVGAWKSRYADELSPGREKGAPSGKNKNKGSSQKQKQLPENSQEEKTETAGAVSAGDLVSEFARAWKDKNPGVPFTGGGGLGKFLKSAIKELERNACPDPAGTVRKAIAAWFETPADMQAYAASTSWAWHAFTRKYPELLRRVRYDERPTQNCVRRL